MKEIQINHDDLCNNKAKSLLHVQIYVHACATQEFTKCSYNCGNYKKSPSKKRAQLLCQTKTQEKFNQVLFFFCVHNIEMVTRKAHIINVYKFIMPQSQQQKHTIKDILQKEKETMIKKTK